MKLVDADCLYKIIEEEFDGCCVYDVTPSEAISDLQYIVDMAPEVEAIPIKWIEEKIKHMKQDCESDAREVIQSLVYWWRAEQKGWR